MELTLPPGTWITVRVDQLLSTDRNQPGDAFTATLSQPLVANGLVIARRGQTVAGVVASAAKAGRVKGTSSLRLELTELSLVDGRQVQVKTTLMERRGNTSVGRDAAAIGTATGVGTMIGLAASCGYGYGAGIGAIAGAAASTIGVLVTRGLPTVVYPEDILAFRTENPVTIQTGSSVDVFQPVRQEDYDQPPRLVQQGPPQGPPPRASYGGYYSPPVYGGYARPFYYGGFYSPYYYGPSFVYYSRPHYATSRLPRWPLSPLVHVTKSKFLISAAGPPISSPTLNMPPLTELGMLARQEFLLIVLVSSSGLHFIAR